SCGAATRRTWPRRTVRERLATATGRPTSLRPARESVRKEPVGPLVFYTGPKGSSDHRAVPLFGSLDHPDTHPMPSLWEVLETIDRTPDALGVVPIETSIDGELMSVVDRVLFATSQVLFSGEAVLS